MFEDISFDIEEGKRVALIAQNGMGKTTLMRILMGQEDPDSGTITYRKDLRIGFLPQEPNYDAEMSVSEACFASDNDVVRAIANYEALVEQTNHDAHYNTLLQEAMAEMDRLHAWDFEVRIKQILGKLNIHDLEQKVGALSGGQQKRLALANVLITQPDLLLLDEPTNHLDLEMVEWLEQMLSFSKITLLMITHDRYFLDNVCNDIIEIDQHQLFRYHRNDSYYLEKREARLENFRAESARAQNLYKKELEWMRRQPQARATKAQSRIDAFYEIEERAKKRIADKNVSLGVKSAYIGSKIFEAQYISKAYGDYKLRDNF